MTAEQIRLDGADSYLRVPERGEAASRPYRGTFITPLRYMEELEVELPEVDSADLVFMYGHAGQGQPLNMLAPALADIVKEGGRARVFRSDPHRHLASDPTGHTRLIPIRFHQSEEDLERGRERDGLDSWLKMRGVDVPYVKSQGATRFHCFGYAGNVHSKLTRLGNRDGSVSTFLLEFNLTNENMAHENTGVFFWEKKQDAERDGSIARTVGNYIEKLDSGEEFDDYYVDIGDDLRFYADAGHRGKSLIGDTARDLISSPSTQDIFWANQYPPSGTNLTAMIENAKQGKPSYVLLSEDCKKGPWSKLFRHRIKGFEDYIHVTYSGKVHSKVLMTNTGIYADKARGEVGINPLPQDVENVAFVGTNNFKRSGYIVGTGEVAFLIKRKKLVAQARNMWVEKLREAKREAAV